MSLLELCEKHSSDRICTGPLYAEDVVARNISMVTSYWKAPAGSEMSTNMIHGWTNYVDDFLLFLFFLTVKESTFQVQVDMHQIKKKSYCITGTVHMQTSNSEVSTSFMSKVFSSSGQLLFIV